MKFIDFIWKCHPALVAGSGDKTTDIFFASRPRYKNGVTILAIMLVAIASPAIADSETDALRAQIKVLEARLDELEKKQKIPSTEYRVPVAENHKQPTIEVGAKGLSVTSPDQQYSLRLRAYAQMDTRTFQNNSNASNVDNFLIRSARPIIDAKMTDFVNGRLMMDFGNNQTRLIDAYADIKPDPTSKLLTLRLGKQKTPVGLERWQSEQEIEFVERGLATNLVPFRDVGATAYGELAGGQLEYNIGVSNGAVDLGDNNGAAGDNKDVSGRIFVKPEAVKGLGVGVAGSYGEHNGTSGAANLTAGYVTIAQSRFFSYSSGAYADGTQWRLNPQAYYYNGAFGAMGEYILNSQEINKAAAHDTLTNSAWMAMVGYVLTGENASFDGVKPRQNFNWKNGDYGAFELVARAGELRVDNSAFAAGGFADSAVSARRAREMAVGANWYFNSSLKFNVDLSNTQFDGGASGGADREDETVLLTRTQFRF